MKSGQQIKTSEPQSVITCRNNYNRVSCRIKHIHVSFWRFVMNQIMFPTNDFIQCCNLTQPAEVGRALWGDPTNR